MGKVRFFVCSSHDDPVIYPCIEHATEDANDGEQAKNDEECEHGWPKMGVKQGVAG